MPMLDGADAMEQVWPLGPVVSALGTTLDIVTQHRRAGHWQPSGSHLDNLHERQPGSRKNLRVTFAGAERLGVALRLNETGILAKEAFQIALTPVERGNSPVSWGRGPHKANPWDTRAPGKIYPVGRTWLVVDPRRRDDLSGLPVHRVICTADPAFKTVESILYAPDEGRVVGDPETLVIIDLSALGYRLCAGLKVDPAEFLITTAPGGGWK